VTFTHRRDRHVVRPWGLAGGEPAPPCRTEIRRADGDRERLPSQARVALDAGDVVAVDTTGGGGYGDPTARPAEAVARDVREGVVSPDRARESYGAVVEEGTVDVAATRATRTAPDRTTTPTVDRGPLPEAALDRLDAERRDGSPPEDRDAG
jgi:N-methylhydantoinase B